MSRAALSVGVVLGAFVGSSVAWAHFPILVPERPATRPDAPLRVHFEFGHPFEREMLTVAKPRTVEVVPPGGDRERLEVRPEAPGEDSSREGASGLPGQQDQTATSRSASAEGAKGKTSALEGERALRWSCSYAPQERGDHILIAEAEPRYEENADEVVCDLVKTTVHVLSQNGWDRAVGQSLEIVPLTRPYGIRPGWTVRFKALLEGAPAKGASVEVERLNAVSPKPPLPQDEFITRTSRTADDGTGLATLDEAGWWGISVAVTRGTARAPDGHTCPRVVRSTLWLYVGEPL